MKLKYYNFIIILPIFFVIAIIVTSFNYYIQKKELMIGLNEEISSISQSISIFVQHDMEEIDKDYIKSSFDQIISYGRVKQIILETDSKILIYSIPNSDSFLYTFLGENWHMFHKLEHTLIFNQLSIMKLCEIFNYKLIELSYPYLETPYANPKKDYENLIDLIQNKKTKSFPFWGNIFQAVLEKI